MYVLQKNYFLGWILKWLYSIPYVVSEQSTIYVDGSFEKMPLLLRKIYSQVFNKAASWHVVSEFLETNIRQKLKLRKKGNVISNVVNADMFCYKPHQNEKATFVHVSNMFYQKNVEGMLQAFAKVKAISDQFIVNLVGPLPEEISALIQKIELVNNVVIWKQRNYSEVAEIMQQSDVFVFFTRYETFGCVIIEANACGLPVIVTDLPVTRELIVNDVNGLFVENENIDELADRLLYVIQHRNPFNKKEISIKTRERFNYLTIGESMVSWLKLFSAYN